MTTINTLPFGTQHLQPVRFGRPNPFMSDLPRFQQSSNNDRFIGHPLPHGHFEHHFRKHNVPFGNQLGSQLNVIA